MVQLIQPSDSPDPLGPAGLGNVPTLGGNVTTAVPPAPGVPSAVQDQQSSNTATQAVAQAIVLPPLPYAVFQRLDPSGSLTMWGQTLYRKLGGYASTPVADAELLSDWGNASDARGSAVSNDLLLDWNVPAYPGNSGVDRALVESLWPEDGVKAWVKGQSYQPQPANSLTKETTGFTDPANITVTYDSTARTITLTGNVEAYYQGKRVPALVSGWVSPAHANTNGPWFLFYDSTGFVWQTTVWTFDTIMIAYVNFGASDKFAIRECHGFMQWQAHQECHETIGTYKLSGGDLSSYTVGSTTAANRRPAVSACTIKDEDLLTVNPALAAGGPYTQLSLTSTGTSTFTTGAAEIVSVTGAQPNWNQFSTPNWVQTAMSNNSYMTIWLVAVPASASSGSQTYRYLWLQGQSNGTLVSEQALNFGNMNLGQLTSLFTEFIPIARVIIQYTAANWTITQVDVLAGSKISSSSSPSGAFLSSVAVTAPLTGAGTSGSPLAIPAATGVVDGYLSASAQTIGGAKTFAALSTFQSGINLGNENLTVYDEGTWAPSATSLGGTGITYTTAFTRIGNRVDFAVLINGTGMTATANSTSITLPLTPAKAAACAVTNTNVAAYGPGLIYVDGKCYLPTIASTSTIAISGTFFV